MANYGQAPYGQAPGANYGQAPTPNYGQAQKKKSPVKIVLLTLLILIVLAMAGIVLWGTNSYRLSLADTYTGTSAVELGGENLYTMDDEITVTLNMMGRGTMTVNGQEYPFTYKYIGDTTDPSVYEQRRFSMSFENDSPLTLHYHPFGSNEPLESNLDSINRLAFRFWDVEEPAKDITIEVPLADGTLFGIVLDAEVD